MFAARAFCLSAAAQSSPPLLVSRPLQGPGVLTQAGESPCGFMPLKFGLGICLQIRSLYAVNPPASASPSQATGIRGTSHHTRLECPLNSGLTQEASTSRVSDPCWLSTPAHRVLQRPHSCFGVFSIRVTGHLTEPWPVQISRDLNLAARSHPQHLLPGPRKKLSFLFVESERIQCQPAGHT